GAGGAAGRQRPRARLVMAGYCPAAGRDQASRPLQARAAVTGTGTGMWDRLTPAARRGMSPAPEEAAQPRHGYIGDDHVLLGLLGEHASQASALLRGHGLDLPGARAELQRLGAAGLTPRSHADDVRALRAVGIDVEKVRQRLVASFGAEAVG